MKGNRENIYLVLEGPGKGGKDTAAKYLGDRFKEKGFRVIQTYEPGGTDRGNLIRQKLFEKKRKGLLTPVDEMRMVYEARRYSMEEVVMPALASIDKTVVIGSRNYLSFVYQMIAGVPYDQIMDYHRAEYVERGYPTPDLTLMIMVNPEVVAERLKEIGSMGDAFDEQGMEFLRQISLGYGELAYRALRRPWKLIGPVITIENNYQPSPEMKEAVIGDFCRSAWQSVGDYFGFFDKDKEGKEAGLVYRRVSPMERSRMRR